MEDTTENSGSMKKVTETPHKNSNSSTGLHDRRAIFVLVLWYIFSASTLFLNKYILSYRNADPHILCGLQMFIAMWCGLFHFWFPCGTYKPITFNQKKPSDFVRKMITLGLLQLGTIIFSLFAVYYVAVSFAETVKSSAPIFTLFIARFILGEKTNFFVVLSLFPVMLGLALCSSHELSFNFIGFICAMITNLCECIQSVVSKSLLDDKTYIYNPAELQFYPNLAATLVQFPTWFLFTDFSKVYFKQDILLWSIIFLNGISFHGQTMTAYVLISYINPLTYSVANTTKRAFLIWVSVLLFGNPVTFFSGFGTFIVIIGVFSYNKAREIDARRRHQFSINQEAVDESR